MLANSIRGYGKRLVSRVSTNVAHGNPTNSTTRHVAQPVNTRALLGLGFGLTAGVSLVGTSIANAEASPFPEPEPFPAPFPEPSPKPSPEPSPEPEPEPELDQTTAASLGVDASTLGTATSPLLQPPPSADASADGEAPKAPPQTKKPKKKRRRRRKIAKRPNPGKYETAQQECKEVITPDIFSGSRIEVNQNVIQVMEKQFGIGVTVGIDPGHQPMGREIAFVATVGTAKDLFWARLDPDLRCTGRYHHTFNDKVGFRSVFNLMEREYSNVMLDLDVKGADWTGNAKFQKSMQVTVLGANYMQSITPSIALGADLSHQFGTQTALAFVARKKDLWDNKRQGETYTASIAPQQGVLSVNYVRKLNENVQLATELMFGPQPGAGPASLSNHASKAVVGYTYKYQTFNFVATIDSTGKSSANLETALNEVCTFCLSGEVQAGSKESTFGVGFRVN